MNNQSMINDLTTGSVAKKLIIFSFPFMLSNFLQTLYTMVDMIIIGQVSGSIGLSAISIGSQLIQFFTFLCIGFASAGQIMIAQYIGKNNHEGIVHTIGTMTTIVLLTGMILGIIGIIFTPGLLNLMNTPQESFSEARNYMIICSAGMVFIFGYNTVSSILRGMGDSTHPFIFIAVAAVINFILDVVFVMWMHMGAAGAAFATIIGQAISFIASAIYLYHKREAFGFDFRLKSFSIDSPTLVTLTKLGMPMALQSAAISISMLFINSYINRFGVVVTAITGIGQKLLSVVSIVTRAISTADSTMIAQNMGAGKIQRVQKMTYIAFAICFIPTIIFIGICLLTPEGIIGIFTSDPATLALSHEYIPILVISFIASAFMSPYHALVNGIGYASLAFFIGIMDGVITRIGLALLLGIGLNMGIKGFWLGDALAGFTTFILAAAYYYSGRWKTRKLIIDQ